MRSLPVRFEGCDVRCDTFYSDFENRNVVGRSLDLDTRLPPGVGVVDRSLDLDARLPPGVGVVGLSPDLDARLPPGVGVVGLSLDLDARRLPPRLTAAAAGSAPPGAGSERW